VLARFATGSLWAPVRPNNAGNRSDFPPVEASYATQLGTDGPVAEGRLTGSVICVSGVQRALLQQRSAFAVEKLQAKIRVMIGHDFVGWPGIVAIWLTLCSTTGRRQARLGLLATAHSSRMLDRIFDLAEKVLGFHSDRVAQEMAFLGGFFERVRSGVAR
jgi:hypothetical protein